MKRSLLPVVAVAAALFPVSACDDVDDQPVTVVALPLAEPEIDDDGSIAFREGPSDPEALYITKWAGGTIRRLQFVQAIMACNNLPNPALTCTLSWYQPDSTKPERVLGIGCSMMADFSLFSCYRNVWLQNGGKPL